MENDFQPQSGSKIPLIISIIAIVLVVIVGVGLYFVFNIGMANISKDVEIKNQEVTEELGEIKTMLVDMVEPGVDEVNAEKDSNNVENDTNATNDTNSVITSDHFFVDEENGLYLAFNGSSYYDCKDYFQVTKNQINGEVMYGVLTQGFDNAGFWFSYSLISKAEYNSRTYQANPPVFQRYVGDKVLLMNRPLDWPEGLPQACSPDIFRFYDLEQ